MNRFVVAALIVIAVALAGCGSFGQNAMSPDQITAAAKAKESNIVCVQATGPWGKAVTTYVNTDKSVIVNGQITVDAECKVLFSNITPVRGAQ